MNRGGAHHFLTPSKAVPPGLAGVGSAEQCRKPIGAMGTAPWIRKSASRVIHAMFEGLSSLCGVWITPRGCLSVSLKGSTWGLAARPSQDFTQQDACSVPAKSPTRVSSKSSTGNQTRKYCSDPKNEPSNNVFVQCRPAGLRLSVQSSMVIQMPLDHDWIVGFSRQLKEGVEEDTFS